MATYNEKALAIKAVNKFGKDVLEIEISGESRFFIVSSFEPPVGGSVSALPYFTFRGFDATDFFLGNIYSEGNLQLFKTKFEALAIASEEHDYKFSESHTWRQFS